MFYDVDKCNPEDKNSEKQEFFDIINIVISGIEGMNNNFWINMVLIRILFLMYLISDLIKMPLLRFELRFYPFCNYSITARICSIQLNYRGFFIRDINIYNLMFSESS